MNAVESIAVQADGKILLAGNMPNDGSTVVMRLNPDGSLDPSFVPETFNFQAPQMIVDPATQKIIVMGSTTVAVNNPVPVTPPEIVLSRRDLVFEVVRLNPDGSFDTSFNSTGEQTVTLDTIGDLLGDAGTLDVPESMAVGPDGAIVMAGQSGGYQVPNLFDNLSAVLIRLHGDGSVDNAFGQNGVLHMSQLNSPQGVFLESIPPVAVAVQADGAIVAASGNGIVRLTTTGTLDPVLTAPANNNSPLAPTPTMPPTRSPSRPMARFSSPVPPRPPAPIPMPTLPSSLNSDGTLDTSFNGTGQQTIAFDPRGHAGSPGQRRGCIPTVASS